MTNNREWMKTLQFLIIVILVTITLYPNIAFADISKSTINANDTQYDIILNTENLSINKILTNLHSYVYNSLDMNITSDKQYNGSLTLTLTKDAVANVFCITRSDVDNYLKSDSAFDVRVDNNRENFTTSTTNDEVSLTFDIPKGSQNATIFNEFVGMAVSPLVHFKGIPQTGTYRSGQDMIFNGTLVDACSRHLGVEKVYFTAEQLNITKEVTSDTKGKFSINFTIPANTESGNYTSKIEMYQYSLAYPLSGVETLYLNVGTNNKQIVPESPLQQFKSGISPLNVKCATNYVLIIKAEDGSPVCVKPNTADILIEHGWATNVPQPNHMTGAKANDPFGITALVIYHPQIACLTPPSHSVPAGMPSCPPNNFYLKINSNSTAYLMGYNICDDNSCAKNNDLSLLLPINTPLYPNYQSIGLPVNLQWKYGDTVNIQLEVSPNADNKTTALIDLGNSTIVS